MKNINKTMSQYSVRSTLIRANIWQTLGCLTIDQYRYIKIQHKTTDLVTGLWGITIEFVGFIPQVSY